MPERQYAGTQMEIQPFVGPGKAQLGQRVQAAPDRGPREAGFLTELRDRELEFTLRESLNHQ